MSVWPHHVDIQVSRFQHVAAAGNAKHTSMHSFKSVDEDLSDTLFKGLVGRVGRVKMRLRLVKVRPGVAQVSCQLLFLFSKILFCLVGQRHLSLVEFRRFMLCARRGDTAAEGHRRCH